jgi:hypothetical protein
MVRLRYVAVGLVALTLALTPARRARADGLGGVAEIFVGGVVLVGAVVVAGVVFTANDAYRAGNDEPSSSGWHIGEAVHGVGAGLGFDIAAGVMGHDEGGGGGTTFTTFVGMWASTLAVHGIWGQVDASHPRPQLGISAAIGANLALTSGAIGVLSSGSRSTVPFGVLEILATTPALVVGIRTLADRDRGDKPAWAALTAWSGVLFAHGVAAFTVGVVPQPVAKRARLPFVLAPAQIGVHRAPGVVAVGAF